MEIIQNVHSYLAYVVLLVLIFAVVNAILGYSGDKLFTLEKDFRISLFGLILIKPRVRRARDRVANRLTNEGMRREGRL